MSKILVVDDEANVQRLLQYTLKQAGYGEKDTVAFSRFAIKTGKDVWRTDELRRPLIMLAVMFTLVFQWQVLMPLLAEVTFLAGPREFGLLSAAAGVGAFVGAITTAHRNREPRMSRMAWFAILVGLAALHYFLTRSTGD
jgi:hypothetical protein